MSYRVEIARTGRAGCQAPACKDEKKLIGKGELRQGVLVTIKEHTSMKWRHWGCVTPMVIKNWKETSEGDMELVDGYEDLPAEAQEKVRLAFEQGHVDDEDWNGDLECNRFNPLVPRQGMFVKQTKKKAKSEANDEESPLKEKASRKRSRKAADADDDNDDAEASPVPKKSRKKAAAKTEPVEEDVAPPPAAKKARGRKAKSETENATEEATEAHEEEAASEDQPKTKKRATKKSKAEADSAQAEAPEEPIEGAKTAKRRGRGKKAASE